MCLAFSAADGETFRLPCGWRNAAAQLYSAASFEASDSWIAAAQQPLVRPAWDVDEVIDMNAAARAQAVLVIADEPMLASPFKLVALMGPDGPASLTAMGLTPVAENLDG
jgi:hypothetical protein